MPQVCNHPELFERADVVAPFSFCKFGSPATLSRQGDLISCHYSTRSALDYAFPEMLYLNGGILDVPSENRRPYPDSGILRNLTNIWNTNWIRHSIEEDGKTHSSAILLGDLTPFTERSPFNFAPLLRMSAGEVHELYYAHTIQRLLYSAKYTSERLKSDPYALYVQYWGFPIVCF